jgi:hypothetical protein
MFRDVQRRKLMENETAEIAVFAERYGLKPIEAMVLPGLFEKAAQIVEKPARAVINAATYTNNELGEYVAGMARKLAETETVKQEYQNFLEA